MTSSGDRGDEGGGACGSMVGIERKSSDGKNAGEGGRGGRGVRKVKREGAREVEECRPVEGEE